MHDLPQAAYVNPAIQPRCNLMIGIPALNSLYINATSTGFSYNDLSAGEQQLNIESIADGLHSVDYLTSEIHANLITLGYRYSDFYFTFNIAEKVDVKAFYPSKIIDLAVYGNDNLIGRTMSTTGLGANATHLREYSLGIAQETNDQLSWGARAKLIFGKANITTRRKPFSFTTEDGSYNLLAEWAAQVNASFPLVVTTNDENEVNGIDVGEINIMKYLFNRLNIGFAADFGVIYKTDPIVWSASILDLGATWWRSDTHQFNNTGSFAFNGLTDDDLNNTGELLETLSDSIQNQIKVFENTETYASTLCPKVNVGGTYGFHPNFNAGVLVRTEFYPRRPVPSLTLSLNTVQLGYLAGSISYSIMNGSYNNVGVGLGIGSKNFVFHLISDNVLAFIWPNKAQTANLRFGMNLLFGCSEKQQKKKKKSFKYSGPGCYTYR